MFIGNTIYGPNAFGFDAIVRAYFPKIKDQLSFLFRAWMPSMR